MKQLCLLVLGLVILSCTSEAQKVEKQKNAPDEQITVKREYDENGNLIRFDSLRVYRWSTDSVIALPPGKGWGSFFGKDFFSNRFDFMFPDDSTFSFPSPNLPFRFLDEEDPLWGLNPYGKDSLDFQDYFLFNDTSFFMGPNSSFMLPPGFYTPDLKGLQELEKLLDHHFKSFSPDEFLSKPEEMTPYRRFMDPKQQEEWDKMIEKQQKEQKEFYKKWNQEKPGKKFEKM